MKKKIFVLLSVLLLAFICSGTASVNAEEAEGATFSRTEYYKAHLVLPTMPLTFEAFIEFPDNMDTASEGGVLLGNYKNNSTPCVNLEIAADGVPKLFVIDKNKAKHTYLFKKANVYTGKTVHLAITLTPSTNTLVCYIDGKEVQSLKAAIPTEFDVSTPVLLGGDYRKDNTNYFKGSVSGFALYKNTRTPSQIQSDAKGTYDTTNLIGFYTVKKGMKLLQSPNNSAVRFVHTDPFVEKEAANDYAYSFAVVGDTQILTMSHPKLVVELYDWIKNNVEEKNIKYVFGLGDITNNDTMGEWTLAKKFMTTLNGVVPYSFVRGNHDSVEQYNRYFPYSEFGSTVDGSYDGTMLNTYKIFTVGNVKYMILCLDMAPSDEVLDWANKVVSDNPDCNVIATTHAYLYQNDYKNAGIWDKFVKKHENVCMVISGHDPCDLIVSEQVKGINGNTVTELLVDPQNVDRYMGGMGLVAMLYFSEDGSRVEIEYICVTNDKYYLEENQYTLTLDVLKTESHETEAESVTEPSHETKAPEAPTDESPKAESKESGAWIIILLSAVGAVAAVAFAAVIIKKKK